MTHTCLLLVLAIDFCYLQFIFFYILFQKDTKINKFIKESEGFRLSNFVGGPEVPLLKFEGDPGVPLLNFRELPGPTFKLLGGIPGPGPTFTPCRHRKKLYKRLCQKKK